MSVHLLPDARQLLPSEHRFGSSAAFSIGVVATLGMTGRDGHYRDIDRHPDARVPDDVTVLRVESSLYFANADAVRARILQAAAAEHIRAVVLDAETVPFIDVTSSRMLAELTDELRERGIRLLIAREVGQVRDVVSHVVEDQVLTNLYPTVEAAVDAAASTTR